MSSICPSCSSRWHTPSGRRPNILPCPRGNPAGLAGSTGAQATVPGQDDPAGVALDGSHVYWAIPVGNKGAPGALWTANLDGTSSTTWILGQDSLTGVAVDGPRIYWTNISDGTVNESNIVGPQPQTLFRGQDDPSSITIGF